MFKERFSPHTQGIKIRERSLGEDLILILLPRRRRLQHNPRSDGRDKVDKGEDKELEDM